MFKTQQMKNTVKRARCGPKESFNCVNHFAACCLMFHQGNKNENDQRLKICIYFKDGKL